MSDNHSIQSCKRFVDNGQGKMLATGQVDAIFPQCEKISIDYAVMEPAAADGKVYTYPADFGWSDLGNWQSLHEKLAKDSHNLLHIYSFLFNEFAQRY